MGDGGSESIEGRLSRMAAGRSISQETAEFLRRRSEAFAKATGGKGKPMTYGAIKKERR